MEKITKRDKIILLVLILGVLIVGVSKIVDRFKSKESIDTSIVVVTDKNKFFIVASCIDKLIEYTKIDDSASVLKMFNEKYIKDNSITESNVLTYLPDFNDYQIFSARHMYQQQLSSDVYKYYVYGYYRDELMTGVGPKQNLYLIVYLYTNDMTFSIEPYSGEIFKG